MCVTIVRWKLFDGIIFGHLLSVFFYRDARSPCHCLRPVWICEVTLTYRGAIDRTFDSLIANWESIPPEAKYAQSEFDTRPTQEEYLYQFATGGPSRHL